MATDVEESDIDDHERPAPPKRQRTRCVKVDENCWETEKQSTKNEDTLLREAERYAKFWGYDEVEQRAREKLLIWQTQQVAKGFVDNTINRMLEYGITVPYLFDLFENIEELRSTVSIGDDMENTAIMTAIHNYGLVQSTELFSEPGILYRNVSCSYPASRVQEARNVFNSIAASSTSSLRLNERLETPLYNGSDRDADRMADNNQQEDFLERAIGEAIKKKGLSALSVDYG